MLKIKEMMDKINSSHNDKRSNLLLALKPYLRESRQTKLDQYMKLLNMAPLLEMYNFPPPYSSYYKNSIRKPKNINTNKAEHKKDSDNSTKSSNDTDSSACINILGIKLYVDDLIILFIIFFIF